MIAEPYICIKGPKSGNIRWVNYENDPGKDWQPYADFERVKLKELHTGMIGFDWVSGYSLHVDEFRYESKQFIGYSSHDFAKDSESYRLLKRAEFLKAVCEKEGVEWLPDCHECDMIMEKKACACGEPFCQECMSKPKEEKCDTSTGKGCANVQNGRSNTFHWSACYERRVKCCGCYSSPTRPCNDVIHCYCPCHKTPEKCKHCGYSIDRFDPCCRKWLDERDEPTPYSRKEELKFRDELLDLLDRMQMEFQDSNENMQEKMFLRIDDLRKRFTSDYKPTTKEVHDFEYYSMESLYISPNRK